MPRQKLIDGVVYDLTQEENDEIDAEILAMDLDFRDTRRMRNNLLDMSDWTQTKDAGLGDHTDEEWVAYRQELRDFPAQSDKVSTLPAWPESPPSAKITRKKAAGVAAYDAAIASDPDDNDAAQAAYDTAYAATD